MAHYPLDRRGASVEALGDDLERCAHVRPEEGPVAAEDDPPVAETPPRAADDARGLPRGVEEDVLAADRELDRLVGVEEVHVREDEAGAREGGDERLVRERARELGVARVLARDLDAARVRDDREVERL